MAGTRMTKAQRVAIFKAVALAVTKAVDTAVKPKVTATVNALFEAAYLQLYDTAAKREAATLLIGSKLMSSVVAVDVTRVIDDDDIGVCGPSDLGAMLVNCQCVSSIRWSRATEATQFTIPLEHQYPGKLDYLIYHKDKALESVFSAHIPVLQQHYADYATAYDQLSQIRAAINNAKTAQELKEDLPAIADVVDKVIKPVSNLPARIDPALHAMLMGLKPIEVD